MNRSYSLWFDLGTPRIILLRSLALGSEQAEIEWVSLRKLKHKKLERERERDKKCCSSKNLHKKVDCKAYIYIYIYILFHLGDIKRVNKDSRDGSGASGKESPLSKP